MNVLKKLEKFKKQLLAFMPDMDEKELKRSLIKIRNHNIRKTKLGVQEVMLYRFLTVHSHNPNTLYSWILLSECPEEIKEQYEKGEISLKEAIKRSKVEVADNEALQMVLEEVNWSYECFFSDGGEINGSQV